MSTTTVNRKSHLHRMPLESALAQHAALELLPGVGLENAIAVEPVA